MTPKRIVCLICYLPISEQDCLYHLVERLNGWIAIKPYCVEYYVPESHSYMLYMIDPDLKRQLCLDYFE